MSEKEKRKKKEKKKEHLTFFCKRILEVQD
jgi:hypothetical protein